MSPVIWRDDWDDDKERAYQERPYSDPEFFVGRMNMSMAQPGFGGATVLIGRSNDGTLDKILDRKSVV